MTTAHHRPDKPFRAQDRECPFCGALGYLVLLSNRGRRRDAAGQGAFLDLAAQEVSHLEIERLRRVVVNGHMLMLGTHGLTCAV